MLPSKCPCCGESQFDHDQLQAGLTGGEKIILSNSGLDGIVHGSVCLSCGFISTYVTPDALAKLREKHPEFTAKDTAR